MKLLIYLITFVFSFASCTKYQYVAMNSQDAQKNKNFWFFENETLRVDYFFNGPNIPVSMRFTNKTGQPMFVDWRNSHLILNPSTDQKKNVGKEYLYDQTTKDESNKIPMTEFMTNFLVVKIEPYESRLFKEMYRFRGGPIDLRNYPSQEKIRVSDSRGDYSRSANLYSETNTPLHFSKELTIHFDEVGQNTMSLTHTFYLHKAFNAGPNFSWTDVESVTLVRDSGNLGLLLVTSLVSAMLIALAANADYEGDYYWDDEDDGW